MTNQESKRQSFLESARNHNKKQEEFYKRHPEQKLYDEGKITWTEYLKLSKETKEKERKLYKGNKNYELYDEGLIIWEEFEMLERK